MVAKIKHFWSENPLHAVLIALGVLCVVRLGMLFTLPFDLYPDEAQYWTWSLEPAFGYFSKPPFIAWLIGLTSTVCGDTEACVRMSAPLIHTCTALVIYALGRRIYDVRTGVMAALLYATLPAVTFSSFIMSTDVPLLFFWALALWSLWNFLESKHWQWAVLLGIALGLGTMSKYAMLYFPLCMALLAATTPQTRWMMHDKRLALAFVLALLIFLPNLIWNASHAGVTFLHTASNANLQSDVFHPHELISFLGGQIGVFGPVLAGILCWGIARRWQRAAYSDRFLFIFSLPLLAIMSVLALVSRANANWAAVAYVGLLLIVTSWLYRYCRRLWRDAALVSHIVIMGLFICLLYLPPHLFPFAMPYPFHRVVGWEQTAQEVQKRLKRQTFSAILTSDRDVFAELRYYLPEPYPELAMWKDGEIGNHYELRAPLTAANSMRSLFVSLKRRNEDVLDGFESAEYLGSVRVVLGPERFRTVRFYEVNGLLAPGTSRLRP